MVFCPQLESRFGTVGTRQCLTNEKMHYVSAEDAVFILVRVALIRFRGKQCSLFSQLTDNEVGFRKRVLWTVLYMRV